MSVVILETSGTIKASETAQHRRVPFHVDVRDPVGGDAGSVRDIFRGS